MHNSISIKSVFSVFLFLLFTKLSIAQLTPRQVRNFVKEASEQEMLVQHSTYLIEGYLFNSDIIADKLLELKPENGNYQYRKAFTLMEVHKDYDGAIKLYEKAAVDVSNKYDIFSTKETSAPTDVYFHLGSCYHLNEQIEKAEEYYQKFIDDSKRRSELIEIAELRLLQCIEAKKFMADPVKIKLKNVGGAINTRAPEFSPVISLDGSALYFTSRRLWEDGSASGDNDYARQLPPEDVYVSYLDFDSRWTSPTRLGFCSPTRNEATSAVSTDERKLFLYMDSTDGGDIYTTDFDKVNFNEIEKLDNAKVNTEYWETHCMVSNDKQKMFFVSDRPGGLGGRDIYFCVLLPDNSWSDPINMGPGVNTRYDEDSPFISIENKTLYYSSNGAQSIGGFDVMKAQLNDDGTWNEGVNLGYPFNSTNDDIFYTTTVDGLKGYMTSHRKDGFGEKDIYEIQNEYLGVQNVAVLQGKITSVDNQPLSQEKVVVVDVNCLDCTEQEYRRLFPRVRDGFYLSGLEPCKEYRVDYQNLTDSVTIFSDKFTTACDTGFQLVEMVLMVNPDFTLYEPVVEVKEPKIEEPKPVVVEAVIETLKADEPIVEVPVETPVVKKFADLDFKQYLGFNKNRLSTNNGELGAFLKRIERQLNEGREEITIRIYASASTVPTQSFKSNDALADKRASNVVDALTTHFAKSKHKAKVKFEIVEAIVQGPEYSGDMENEEKYGPFQYVALYTK